MDKPLHLSAGELQSRFKGRVLEPSTPELSVSVQHQPLEA